jgi:hypothetical protein
LFFWVGRVGSKGEPKELGYFVNDITRMELSAIGLIRTGGLVQYARMILVSG